tara:strand:- start:88216 stop:89697 length:1482 start_codon:yes stop_codon:yes gene_type:complete
MRIATKLVLGSTLGMLVILAVHGVLTFQREMAIIETDQRQEGERLANAIALAVGLEWDQSGQAPAMELLRELDSKDTDIKISWLNASHERNPSEHERIRSAAVDMVGTSQISSDVLHSYAPVRSNRGVRDASRGTVQISQVLSDERARIRDSLGQLGLAVLLILIFNAILAMVLSKQWVQRPVAALRAMAEKVGNGEFGARSNLTKKSGSEFAELGSALNTMASHLQEFHAAREQEYQRRMASEAQLQHAERLITVGKLASGVAHEIGTPLNVITGHADMIRRGQVDTEGAVKSAEVIGAHAGRITSIIKELLGFSRRHGPERADVDLAGLSKQAAESMLRAYAHKRGVTLDTDGLDKPSMAFVDATQMQQVVSNLVMNGVQAMKTGGILTIALQRVDASPPAGSELEAGRYLRLQVTDTGHGISSEEQKHIFEPFFTTKDVGEGTGLGLSIAYGIVRDHDGWFEVASELGKGTTFSMFIPAGRMHDSHDPNR